MNIPHSTFVVSDVEFPLTGLPGDYQVPINTVVLLPLATLTVVATVVSKVEDQGDV